MNPAAEPFAPMLRQKPTQPTQPTQPSTIVYQPRAIIVCDDSYKYFQYEFDRCIDEIRLIHPKARNEIMIITVSRRYRDYVIISNGFREIICSADKMLQIIAEEVNNIRPIVCYTLNVKKFKACCKVMVCSTIDHIFARQYSINFHISTSRLGIKSEIINFFAKSIADELSCGYINDKMLKLCKITIPGIDIRKILRDPRFEMITGFRYNIWLGEIYKFSSQVVIL